MSDNQNHNRNNDDTFSILNYFIMALMGCLVAVIILKYFALMARYVYFSYLFPFYVFRKLNLIYELLFGILIAVTLSVIWFYKRVYKGNKETSLIWLFYAFFILLSVVLEITGLPVLTGFVDSWCNPNLPEKATAYDYATSIFDCQLSEKNFDTIGIVEVFILAFMPNLLLSLWANYQVYSSFFRLNIEHPKAIMNKKLDLEGLIKIKTYQQNHLKYYLNFDLNKLPIDAGQFRKLDSGRKFMYRHNLIERFVPRQHITSTKSEQTHNEDTKSSQVKANKDDLVPLINQDAFNNLMIQQLGDPFIDVDSLSPLFTIMLAITIPKACLADTLLDNPEMNTDPKKQPNFVEKKIKGMISELWIWAEQKLNARLQVQSMNEINLGPPADASDFPKLEEYREFLREWIDFSYIAQNLIKEHAYCSTLLMGSLSISKGARKLGVMAPADFRWVCEYDRSMWAIIQNVDRSAAFSENIASVSHYYSELTAGKGLIEPMFQAAYEGFMKEVTLYNYPKEHIEAWHRYQKGDPSLMIRYRLITKDESIYAYAGEKPVN